MHLLIPSQLRETPSLLARQILTSLHRHLDTPDCLQLSHTPPGVRRKVRILAVDVHKLLLGNWRRWQLDRVFGGFLYFIDILLRNNG